MWRYIFAWHTAVCVFDDVTEDNESSWSKVVSQTHTICNLGVCVSAECSKISAVCSNILWMSVSGRAVCKLNVLSSQERKKQGYTTRYFQITTAVNTNNMMLRFVTPCSFVQGYKVSEGSSDFTFKITWRRCQCLLLNTPYLFVLIIMSVQQPSTNPQPITIHNHV